MSTRPASTVDAPVADAEGIISIADGNIKKRILVEGHGPTPTDRSDVTVHYTGRLLDGTVFDSSVTRNEPFVFKIGKGQVIKGWDQGVATMKVGEKAILTCSPSFAYGARGSPPKIPANATLEFEVELLSFDNTQNVTEDKQVKKAVKVAGTGHNRPSDQSTVVVKYSGKVKGEAFEPFVSHMDAPVTLQLGRDASLVWGLEEGIKNMHEGERSTIFVSPSYAYGGSGDSSLSIPPNAELEFDVELVSFERGPDSSTMDFDSKLAHMGRIKDLGNACFKAGQMKRAQAAYAKAMSVFPYLEALEDEQKAAVTAVQLACISNVVITHVRAGPAGLDEVIKQAGVGLALNPRHVKLLYNRGAAYNKQGLLAEAESDLKAAAEADPANQDVQRELRAVKAKVKAIADKEKKAFGGFFGRVKLVSDEEEKAAKEAAAKAAVPDMNDDSSDDDEAEDAPMAADTPAVAEATGADQGEPAPAAAATTETQA